VVELEMRVLLLQLAPQLPNAEAGPTNVDVVKQRNAVLRYFRQPDFEIMAHGVIRMEATEMEEIERSIPETQQRHVECAPQQRRKRSVMLVRKATKVLIDGLIVKRRLRNTRPGIDGKTVRLQLLTNGLAERGIANAVIRPQLDRHPRPRRTSASARTVYAPTLRCAAHAAQVARTERWDRDRTASAAKRIALPSARCLASRLL
jgi:hypothetical protein